MRLPEATAEGLSPDTVLCSNHMAGEPYEIVTKNSRSLVTGRVRT
jgi:hypothetical protein